MSLLAQITQQLFVALNKELPGARAHESLRAQPIGTMVPKFEHTLPPKQGAVLILLYEEQEKIKFPLIKRSTYLGAHSGQISLPGGKTEYGETIIEAALRESEEEVGADRNKLQVVGTLSEFYVVPSNFIITPVVAIAEHPPHFVADTREVEKIIHADIHYLLSPEAIKTKELLAAGRYRMQAPHFEIENEIVWGATAMILNELRTVLLTS